MSAFSICLRLPLSEWYILEIAPCPSWSGFMKVAMKNGQYERSRIVTLQFINLDPSNLSTIV